MWTYLLQLHEFGNTGCICTGSLEQKKVPVVLAAEKTTVLKAARWQEIHVSQTALHTSSPPTAGGRKQTRTNVPKSDWHRERRCTSTCHKQAKLRSQVFTCPYHNSSNSSSRWASIVKRQWSKLQGVTLTAWQQSWCSGHNTLRFSHSLNAIQRQSTEKGKPFLPSLPAAVSAART